MYDPYTEFLQIFFDTALSPELPVWNVIKASLPHERFTQLHSFLVEALIDDYNCRLLLKTCHIELHKNPSEFPAIFVEHYNTNESLGWCWNRWVVPQWPEMDGVTPPEVTISLELANEVIPKLSGFVKTVKVVSKPKWRVAAFQLNPKEVLKKSVKYILFGIDDKVENPVDQNKEWKVEVAMKLKTDCKTGEDSSNSQVLLAQCILRLHKSPNFSIKINPINNDNALNLEQFIQIHESVPVPAENVLVSFSAKNWSGSEEHVMVEINSKDYYSQYSEAVVILYNYARITTILERYDSLVENKEYPELPSWDNVNFNLIGESKDEFPIIMILFMWPCVKKSVINVRRRGKGLDKINLPFLFDFIKSLARAFDTFYNRNVVIVPPSAPHNFDAMFARLYLLKSIAVVFKEFIYLTGIQID